MATASPSRSAVPDACLAVRGRMEREFHAALSLTELAAEAGRSPQRFSLQFKRFFGVSPVEYLIRLRLAEVVALLQNYNLAVKGIAGRTGFPSAAYFCQRFRQRYGSSPQQARGRLAPAGLAAGGGSA